MSYTDNVNAGTATASATYAESANHLGSSDSETFEILKAPVTVTASSHTVTYGDPAPTVAPGYDGFVNSETSSVLSAAPTCTTTYVPTSAAGSAQTTSCGGAVAANYNFAYVGGTVAVNQRPLTITANNRIKVYGDAVAFAGTEFAPAGLVNTDAVASVTLTSVGAATTAAVGGSPYPIVPSAAVGSGLSNYAITYANGSLTVNAAVVTVTGKSTSRPFGTPNPDLSQPLSITGFVNAETAAVITVSPTCGTSATLLAPVGAYAVTCSNGVAANYTFAYVAGTLTIGSWHLTGFYQPVGIPNTVVTPPTAPLPSSGVWNSIKGGQTVPLKFEIFTAAGGAERTNLSDVSSFTLARVGCSAGPEDPVEPFPTSGATVLRYDAGEGQFIQNWQSPKGANQCYRVTMTALDGSSLSAFFKTK